MANRIIGMDEREVVWNLSGYQVLKNDTRARSSYHLNAREILHSLYPVYMICEEVVIPGSKGMKLDFYLPQISLAVEVNGEQHYKCSAHFHTTDTAFRQGKMRDLKKQRWCERNNIQLVVLKFDEVKLWEDQIVNC